MSKKTNKAVVKYSIELKKKYADANNPHKEGDIIQDHCGKGLIEKIGYSFGYNTTSGAAGPRVFYQVLEKIVD
jgi:hypothetical protein